MTNLDKLLAEVRELKEAEKKATPGPWSVGGSGTVVLDWRGDDTWAGTILASANDIRPGTVRCNSQFIVLSRNLCRTMIEEIERLRTQLAKAREALKKIEGLPPIYERDRRELAREALRSIDESGVLK